MGDSVLLQYEGQKFFNPNKSSFLRQPYFLDYKTHSALIPQSHTICYWQGSHAICMIIATVCVFKQSFCLHLKVHVCVIMYIYIYTMFNKDGVYLFMRMCWLGFRWQFILNSQRFLTSVCFLLLISHTDSSGHVYYVLTNSRLLNTCLFNAKLNINQKNISNRHIAVKTFTFTSVGLFFTIH